MGRIEQFPRIDNTYFGGNQVWMKEKKHAAGGCGVIAAANLVEYYRGHGEVSKDRYMVAVESLYHWLAPLHLYNPFAEENTYGLPFFRQYVQRLNRYLLSIGISRQPEFLKKPGYRAAEDFVRRSIDESDPVILLVIGHRKLKRYNNHYMTITGYDETDFVIHVSTWGVEETMPLREIYQQATIFRLARLKVR